MNKLCTIDYLLLLIKNTPKNVIHTCFKALQITEDELNKSQHQYANLVIEPELGDITQFNFYRAKHIITQGEEAMVKKLGVLKRMLK